MFIKKIVNGPSSIMKTKICCSTPALSSLISSPASFTTPKLYEIKTDNKLEDSKLRTQLINKIDFYRRQLPESCISFSSSEGKQIFKESLISGHLDCYFPLAAQFRTQDEPAFCGLSTLVMVLNSLEVDPKRVWKGPWRWYHENMLDCCVPLIDVEKKGITMEQFSCLAACNMLKVKMTRVDETASEDAFRKTVKIATKKTNQVLVTSYSRIQLGQTGDGHFSPIGGYNVERDMVLIMDTARFKYPPHWVTVPLLFKAMQMIDPTSELPRGYFVLSKRLCNPGILFRLSSYFNPLGMPDKLVTFLKSWEAYLDTDLTNVDLTESEIVETAIMGILKNLPTLSSDTYLLTTQIDTKLAERISYKFYLNSLKQLINILENLPFFSILSSKCLHANKASLTHAGIVSELPSIEMENLNSILKPTHFLAVFLLSWPYKQTENSTLSGKLKRYFSSHLLKHNASCLHNECVRIRQQLKTLIGYNKQCQQGCCN